MPMKVIFVKPDRPDESSIKEAIAVLLAGGTVVFPTDTAYGLAIDALNDRAIGKVFIIKQRIQKPLPVLVSSIAMAKKVALVTKAAEELMHRYWPGAVTFILKRKPKAPASLTAGLPTIGVRRSAHPLAQAIVEDFGRPITSTSANISGKGASYSVDEVLRNFRDTELQPDLVLDGGILPETLPSTVVDLTTSPPRVTRKGPVTVTL